MCIWPRCCGFGNVVRINSPNGIFDPAPAWQKSVVTRAFYEYIAETITVPSTLQEMRIDMDTGDGGLIMCIRPVDYGDYFVIMSYVTNDTTDNPVVASIQKWSKSGTVLQEVLIQIESVTWGQEDKEHLFAFWDDANDICGYVARVVTGTFGGTIAITKHSWSIGSAVSLGPSSESSVAYNARITPTSPSLYACQYQNRLIDLIRLSSDPSLTARHVVADFEAATPESVGDYETAYLFDGAAPSAVVINNGSHAGYAYSGALEIRADILGNVTDGPSDAARIDQYGQFLKNSSGVAQRYVSGEWETYIDPSTYASHSLWVKTQDEGFSQEPTGAEDLVSSIYSSGTKISAATDVDIVSEGNAVVTNVSGVRPGMITPGVSAMTPYVKTGGLLQYTTGTLAGVVPVEGGALHIIDHRISGMAQLTQRYRYFRALPPD